MIFPTMVVEDNRAKLATGATNVDNKVYPDTFRRWTEFPTLHAGRFDLLVRALGDSEMFPSLFEVRSTSRNLSPTTRKDEQDIRPFIRAHVELPANKILDAYLEKHPDPRCAAFEFSNNAYGLSRDTALDNPPPKTHHEDQPPPSKRQSPDRMSSLAPDRWGIRVTRDHARTTALVAEYKAAHKARVWRFKNVLGDDTCPTNSLFADCVSRLEAKRTRQSAAHEPEPSPSLAQDQMIVATVLCQAYHYMIAAGLLYGYVGSGDCMVFLAIQGTPGVLYFHFVPSSMDIEGLQPTADVTRSTPAAQLATLALLALEAETQSLQWVQKALAELRRWPSAKKMVGLQSQGIGGPSLPPPPPPPPPPNDDEQGGGSRSRKTLQKRSLAKRTREETSPNGSGSQSASKDDGSQIGSQRQTTRTSLRALPYCTQACLLGLSRNGTLDPNCPNTPLHVRPRCGSYHPISKVQLCSLFRSQLAQNLDCGCESLEKYGMFGRTGVLFKITIPEYGYTLVAKGVQAAHADALVREARIYFHCKHLQGIWIPVHLGNIELVVSYPLQSLALVKHMMLMSWAGTTLEAYIPDSIDIDSEIDRTVGELNHAGVCNGDVRDTNLVWNEEVKRVMAIDFDLAYIPTALKRSYESASDEERGGKVRKVQL
ncbi:hypothetical protein B0T22DRAFT_414900 [Podospora appendiculata]|uniref:Uncharacterized protein n=1 Tax=Podospora appendiculata TaxID=314037 RepID=A0AAE0X0C1_9PEZI|nr:hypothetical protein B0T22DRAFT_414900 [Podospora appendiculata]